MLCLGDSGSYMDRDFQAQFAAGIRAQREMRDRVGGDITISPWSSNRDQTIADGRNLYGGSAKELREAEDRLQLLRGRGGRSAGAMGGRNPFWAGF